MLQNQGLLQDLNNPQVELHLLRSCLGFCKINNLLRTVTPGTADQHWSRFDSGVRHCLEGLAQTSLPDLAWLQASLSMRLGGLGLRQAALTSTAAFLGSCQASRQLVTHLLQQNTMSLNLPCEHITIPGEVEAQDRFSELLASYGSTVSVDMSTFSQRTLQAQLDNNLVASLKEESNLRDQARLNTVASPHASAWLRAIPNANLGLTLPKHEFVVAVKLWLGIPIFPSLSNSIRCTCGHIIDVFGDHLLGCGHVHCAPRDMTPSGTLYIMHCL